LRMEMTPWFLHRAHFGDRCAIEPIEGIGEGFSSVEEGAADTFDIASGLSLAEEVASSAAIAII